MNYVPIVRMLRAVLITVIMLVCGSAIMYAADTTIVLKVFHFDGDCLPDTLVGIRMQSGRKVHITPTSIKWGWGYCTIEENGIRREVPSTGFRETALRFPQWNKLSILCFHDNLSNDKVQDLVFNIRGKRDETADTGRFIVIFGQAVLKQIPVIDIALIDTNSSIPFITRELRKGENLSNPQKHDLSGGTMWAINPFDITIKATDEQFTKRTESDFRIVPNPASTYTEIESLKNVPAGMYEIELYDGNARRLIRKSITLAQAGDVRSRLDLHTLSSGYYTVRVFSGGQEVADLLFMIIR